MTPVFAARRRAEKFAALVEGASTGRADDARYSDLLELVAAMRETPAAEARPEFVADLRARLMAEADTALVPADTSRLTLPARRPPANAASRPRSAGSRSSAPPRRWRWPPRAPCPATPSTRSSAPRERADRTQRGRGTEGLDAPGQRPRPPRRGDPAQP